MKIWKSFSGEHSAKLRIIGTFKTEEDAEKAANCFNDLLAVENKDKGNNLYFSEEIMEVIRNHDFHYFNENDPEQLDYFYELEANGNKIVVDTDEVEIQALMKVLLSFGAKIEVYSRHNYPTN